FGDAKSGEAGAGLREKTIGMSVVAGFKFYKKVALGHAAREAHRAHGGFGAAGHEADFFDERNRARNQRGEFQFEFGSDAEAGAAFGLLGDGRGDGGIRVTQKDRAPGADVVEQLVSVGIVKVLAFTTLND